MAIEIKRKAPQAHTVCEIVKARYVTVWSLYIQSSFNLCFAPDLSTRFCSFQ